MNESRTISLVIAFPLVAITLLIVAVMFAGGSAGGTLPTGRSVMTHSDAITLSSTLSVDTATIKTAGKTIVVHPSALTVDGVTVANIDKDAANVQVCVKRGEVTFVVDGAPIRTSLR